MNDLKADFVLFRIVAQKWFQLFNQKVGLTCRKPAALGKGRVRGERGLLTQIFIDLFLRAILYGESIDFTAEPLTNLIIPVLN